MAVRWFNRRKTEETGPEGLALHEVASMLISRFSSLITTPEKAVKVFSTIKAFEKSGGAEKLDQLPPLYLLLENYLTEFEAVRPTQEAELRRRVQQEFPQLLQLPHFALIFAGRMDQELALCRSFVHASVQNAFPLLGETLKPVLELTKLSDWNSQAIRENLSGGQTMLQESSEIRRVQQISLALFSRLEKALGIESTVRVFEKAYEKLALQFSGLDSFPIVVQMLPEKVLDEKKISLLNRRQMERAMVTNIEALQKMNTALENKNSELLQLNEMLVRTKEELAEANRAKSMFLASMSHELRTPLNAVLGFSQILEKDLTLTATQRYYVSIMHRSGSHLLGMINDVLDLSKIDAGQMERVDSVFDLHYLLQDIREMFSIMAREKMIDLSLMIAPDVPRWVRNDESKVRQILINLVGNAVKYTRAGYVAVVVEFKSPQKRALFKIRDTGIGIPSEKIEQIFDPFRQVHGSESKGTGLGLSISKRLATMLGGNITVSSAVGRGSEFVFDAIFQPSEAAGKTGVSIDFDRPVHGIKGGLRPVILVVDDVQENRVLLGSLLSTAGFQVLEASNGLDCLEVIHTHQVDAVLLDLVMPVMDGYKALKEIRKDNALLAVKSVAITAGVLSNERDEVLQHGFDAFISKPFKDSDLYKTLADLLKLEYDFGSIAIPNKEAPKNESGDQVSGLVAVILKQPPSIIEMIREVLELSDYELLLELLPERLFKPGDYAAFQKNISDKNFRFFLQLDELLTSNLTA